VLLVALFAEMVRMRADARVDAAAPTPPPVSLGSLLQRFLAAFLQKTPPALLLHLVESPASFGAGGAAVAGAGGAEEEVEVGVLEGAVAAVAPYLPRLLIGETASANAGEEVRSAVTLSGKTRVSRVSAQVRKRALYPP